MTTSEIDTLLKSRDTKDRLRAVGAMARRADPADAPRLIKLLKDRSAYVSQQAAEALSKVATTEHGPALIAEFARLQTGGSSADPGCYIRTSIAYVLGRMEFHSADDLLREGIRTVQVEGIGGVPTDTACQLRAACALALAEMRALNAVLDITPLLFDDRLRYDDPAPRAIRNPSVRIAAAQALGRLGDRAALAPLTVKLMYPIKLPPYPEDKHTWQVEDDEVLVECMRAAIALDPEYGGRLTRPYLTRGDESMIAQTALIYAQSGLGDAAEQVAAAVERVSGENQLAVILTLASMRTDDAFEKLCALAASPRQAIRLAFIEAVATIGDPHARPVLEALAAGDSSDKVRAAAVDTLAEIS